MKPAPVRRKYVIVLPIAIAITLAVIVTALLNVQRPDSRPLAEPSPQKLPEDVERVIEGYTYRETGDGLSIDISGNRVIHRGRQMLGLRSNLIKTTFFSTIRGKLRAKATEVKFSASAAEWDTRPSSPLLLTRNVLISVNNQPLHGVKTARIYFQKRVMEVTGEQKETVYLR